MPGGPVYSLQCRRYLLQVRACRLRYAPPAGSKSGPGSPVFSLQHRRYLLQVHGCRLRYAPPAAGCSVVGVSCRLRSAPPAFVKVNSGRRTQAYGVCWYSNPCRRKTTGGDIILYPFLSCCALSGAVSKSAIKGSGRREKGALVGDLLYIYRRSLIPHCPGWPELQPMPGRLAARARWPGQSLACGWLAFPWGGAYRCWWRRALAAPGA